MSNFSNRPAKDIDVATSIVSSQARIVKFEASFDMVERVACAACPSKKHLGEID